MMSFVSRNLLLISEIAVVAVCASLIFSIAPGTAHAATKPAAPEFEFSGWIPYWRVATGTAEVSKNIDSLTEVNPFGYTVKKDGKLNDALNVKQKAWQDLFKLARAHDVLIIPTVMTSDTQGIYKTLANKKSRTAHVKAIVAMVRTNHFDGVDIDYEGKSVETKEYYSLFLKELKAALPKGTILSCTIEARTPPTDLYKTIPTDLEYVNDFTVINTYCDRVKIMTYDQQRAVLTLNDAAKGVYAPIADPAWVRKVLTLTTKDIDAEKIQLGVATYGYIYQLMPSSSGKSFQYILTEAFNPGYADQIASQYGLTPVRNSAGELSLTYVPTTNPAGLPSQSKLAAFAPKGTASAYLASSGALAYAKQTKKQAPVELLSWSDAKAIEDKVKLAKEFGLAGIAIFKLDGGGDKGLWRVLDTHSRLTASSGI